MRKHLLAMAGAAALGFATVASGPVSAGALQPAPGLGSAADSDVIQVQGNERGGRDAGARSGGQRSGSDTGARSGGQRSGPSDAARGNVRSGKAANTARRATQSQRSQVQRRSVQRPAVSSPRNVNRDSRVTAQRRGDHRPVRRGWSRDRRHVFYGAYVLGVPLGFATYASHPCYSWLIGPQGPGYYWNYLRCPV